MAYALMPRVSVQQAEQIPLKQIEDMGYAKPYAADQRTLLKIGVNFDSKERSISGWEVLPFTPTWFGNAIGEAVNGNA